MEERVMRAGDKDFLKNYGARLRIVWAPFLVASMLLMLGLSGMVGYELGWLDEGPWVDGESGELTAPLMVYFWFGLFVLVMATAFHAVWNLVLRRQPGVFGRRQLQRVLASGQPYEATVLEREQLSNYKRGARPLEVVVFELSGDQKASFGTFVTEVLEEFEPGQSVEVLWTPEEPEVAIPRRLAPA